MKTEQELKREAGGQPRNGDYLLAAELSAEQNMNMLDGIPNNEKPRVNQNYVILESEIVGQKEFVLAQNPNAPQPYVTWERNMQEDERRGEENFYWGKYFCDPEAAEKNFHDRADGEREFLRDLRPSLLKNLRQNQEEITRPAAPARGGDRPERGGCCARQLGGRVEISLISPAICSSAYQ